MKEKVFSCLQWVRGASALAGAVGFLALASVAHAQGQGFDIPPDTVEAFDPFAQPANPVQQSPASPGTQFTPPAAATVPPAAAIPQTPPVPPDVGTTDQLFPPPVSKPHVVVFRGMIGAIYSAGMDDLAKVLRSKGYEAKSYPYTSAATALKWARASTGKIAIIGHSAGGTAALEVARQLGRKGRSVCLLATLDPVGGLVPKNVQAAINFREGVFSYLTGISDIQNHNVRVLHPDLDDDLKIRQQIINALEKKC